MKPMLSVVAVVLFLTSPILAHAQSDDWLLMHPYEQPERTPHGDMEIQDDLDWEKLVFQANEYRYRQEAEQTNRAMATTSVDSAQPKPAVK
jgi:hypothetical protein